MHAMVMCRFAHEIHQLMSELTKDLEVQLGPGTSDLKMRIGLHSGSVVAGVLRGEKSRFQVFGDCMNTTARLESTGIPGMTHASKATADLLIKAGKRHWLTPRKELVQAKGKGELPQTYWVAINRRSSLRMKALNPRLVKCLEECLEEAAVEAEEETKCAASDDEDATKTITTNDGGATMASGDWGSLSLDDEHWTGMKSETQGKNERLVEWTTEVMSTLLNNIERRRRAVKSSAFDGSVDLESGTAANCGSPQCNCHGIDMTASTQADQGSSDESVQEERDAGGESPITLPVFDPSVMAASPSLQSCSLSNSVREQLRAYVADVKGCYSELPFRKYYKCRLYNTEGRLLTV